MAFLARWQVYVDMQMNSIYNLVEKNQQYNADFQLVVSWNDARLRNPKAPRVDEKPVSILSSIWNPSITFANRRDTSNPIEGSVLIRNDGNVTVSQRYLAAYSVNLDIRDFPL